MRAPPPKGGAYIEGVPVLDTGGGPQVELDGNIITSEMPWRALTRAFNRLPRTLADFRHFATHPRSAASPPTPRSSPVSGLLDRASSAPSPMLFCFFSYLRVYPPFFAPFHTCSVLSRQVHTDSKSLRSLPSVTDKLSVSLS